MNPIIDIAHLDFAYGEQLVLKQVTLPVAEGSTLGLIGPNGGGKTTLIRLLLGLHRPTRGSIQIDGRPAVEAVRAGDVLGYVPQNYALSDTFPVSARQVARMGLIGKTGMLRPHPASDLAFVEDLLDRVGVMAQADRPIGSLSGGQRQRVYIARALAARPKILLLDEPTTGIDRAGQERFTEFLLALKRDLKLTVVLVSHDLRAVWLVADRIACLNVTLHYHDVPQHMPRELAAGMFSCDLESLTLERSLHGVGDAHPTRVDPTPKTPTPHA